MFDQGFVSQLPPAPLTIAGAILLGLAALATLALVRGAPYSLASRLLRNLITDTLREGRAWLPPEALAERLDVTSLMATARRGMHGVGNVALAHFQALDSLVRGPGQLWMPAAAITQSAYRGHAVVEAACRHGWVPMPPGEPAGRALLADAKRALTTTMVAVAALDGTAAGEGPTADLDGGVLRWERGRIVAREAADQPRLFETVQSSGLSGSRTERRTPIPIGRRSALGPRR